VRPWCEHGVRAWCAGCCPALGEGRAENFGAPVWCLCVLLVRPNRPLVRQNGALAVPQQNAALPSRREGSVSKLMSRVRDLADAHATHFPWLSWHHNEA